MHVYIHILHLERPTHGGRERGEVRVSRDVCGRADRPFGDSYVNVWCFTSFLKWPCSRFISSA